MLIIQNIINLQVSQENFEAVITIIKVKEQKTSYWKRKRKARFKKKKRSNNLKVFPLVGKGEYISVPLPETFRFSFSHDLHFYSTFECEGNRQGSVADGLSAKCVSM
jgi:hypothetical protein